MALVKMSGDVEPNHGPVGVLGPDDLVDVLTELVDLSADWENIGLGLRLKAGTLDAMKGRSKGHKDCLRDMLKDWLNTSPDPSWQSLIQVLKSPIVRKNALASHLEAKFCIQEGSVLPPGVPMPPAQAAITKTDWTEAQVRVRQLEVKLEGELRSREQEIQDLRAQQRRDTEATELTRPTYQAQPLVKKEGPSVQAPRPSTHLESHPLAKAVPSSATVNFPQPPVKASRSCNVLLVGRPGAGTSSLANAIIGKDKFPVDSSVASVKLHMPISEVKDTVNGVEYKIKVINTITPFDTGEFERNHRYFIREIQDFVQEGISLILFVVRVGRFTDEERHTFDLIMKVFGDKVSDISALVLTHCEQINQRAREKTVEHFKSSEDTKRFAEFAKKGIYTVGFPDVSEVPDV